VVSKGIVYDCVSLMLCFWVLLHFRPWLWNVMQHVDCGGKGGWVGGCEGVGWGGGWGWGVGWGGGVARSRPREARPETVHSQGLSHCSPVFAPCSHSWFRICIAIQMVRHVFCLRAESAFRFIAESGLREIGSTWLSFWCRFFVCFLNPLLGPIFDDFGAQKPPRWRPLGGHLVDFLGILWKRENWCFPLCLP